MADLDLPSFEWAAAGEVMPAVVDERSIQGVAGPLLCWACRARLIRSAAEEVVGADAIE